MGKLYAESLALALGIRYVRLAEAAHHTSATRAFLRSHRLPIGALSSG
jgi:hypothetical protein